MGQRLGATFSDRVDVAVASGWKGGRLVRIDQAGIAQQVGGDRARSVDFRVSTSGFDLKFNACQVVSLLFNE